MDRPGRALSSSLRRRLSRGVRGGALALVASLLLVSHSKAGSVTFFDGTFADADWSVQAFLDGTVSSLQVGAGGNPGEFRQTEHANLDTGQSILVAHLHAPAVYDPAADGEIAAIDLALDVKFLGGSTGTLQVGYRLLAEQGGSLFVGGASAVAMGPGDGAPAASWESFAVPGLVATDFTLLDGSGDLDFSAAGAPITFGFHTSNTVTLDGTSTLSGIDNWSVAVHAVPEPVRELLFVTGLVVLATAARRRRAPPWDEPAEGG